MNTLQTIPAVSAAIFRDKKVLIVLRSKGAAKNKWSLPGGHIIDGETAENAAEREVMEETGINCLIVSPVTQLDIPVTVSKRYRLSVFCGLWQSGEITASSDAADARWIEPDLLNTVTTTDNLSDIIQNAHKLILNYMKT